MVKPQEWRYKLQSQRNRLTIKRISFYHWSNDNFSSSWMVRWRNNLNQDFDSNNFRWIFLQVHVLTYYHFVNMILNLIFFYFLFSVFLCAFGNKILRYFVIILFLVTCCLVFGYCFFLESLARFHFLQQTPLEYYFECVWNKWKRNSII